MSHKQQPARWKLGEWIHKLMEYGLKMNLYPFRNITRKPFYEIFH